MLDFLCDFQYIKNLVIPVVCWIICGCLDYKHSRQVKVCIYYGIT